MTESMYEFGCAYCREYYQDAHTEREHIIWHWLEYDPNSDLDWDWDNIMRNIIYGSDKQ